jgi:hypothetical protein
MENAPVIEIVAWKFQPEYQERWGKWQMEVFFPILTKSKWVKRIERYERTKESAKYIRYITIRQYEDLEAIANFEKSPEWIEIFNDMKTTWANRRDVVWHAAYQLIKSFSNTQTTFLELGEYERVENVTIMHLEGYGLPFEKEANYEDWVSKWGCDVFIPLLMKLPGLQEYSLYKLIDYDWPEWLKAKDFDAHPPYLSVLHFQNINAFRSYENSAELAAFKYALRVPFPRGLDNKWYVQYQLMKSWGK